MNTRQRGIDWMMSLADEYHLHSYTVHYAASLFDVVSKKVLQVPVKQEMEMENVVIVCMKISGYMNELLPPPLSECMGSDYSTSLRDRLIYTEQRLLEIMDFNFSDIDTYHRYAMELLPMSIPFTKADVYLKYVMDMCLLSFDFCEMHPRIVAQACVLIVLERYTECVVKGVIDLAAVEMKERIKQAMSKAKENTELYTHCQFEKNMKKCYFTSF